MDNFNYNRISNAVYNAREKYVTCIFGFCDETEQSLLLDIIRPLNFRDYMFWGGYSDAERKCLGIFPGKPIEDDFQISFVKISADKFGVLTHRDCMGALLGCGIKRDVLGDIVIIDEHTAYAAVFNRDGMAQYIASEVSKIGRAQVKCSVMEDGFVPNFTRKFEDIKFTVSSLRFDCVVAGAVNTSRSAAAKLIADGAVMLNHKICTRPDISLKCGDVFSVHKKGKFVMQEDDGLTKKEKIRVNIKKYL